MSFFVYALKGSSGRHYIGVTSNLALRLQQHRNGQTHTSKRLGSTLEMIAAREFPTRAEAARIEKMLKAWKSPVKAIAFLNERASHSADPRVRR
jgi:predicted GIY-YIG superfamily endonuclease